MASILGFRRWETSRSSFEALVRPHLEHLYRLAWRLSGNAADAEDLVQELLLKLYQRREELAAIDAPRPWMARVLYRQFVDAVRRRGRAPAIEDLDGSTLEGVPDPAQGPEELAERGQVQKRLLWALGQLNPEQRALVALHDVEGYTLEELVTVLEAPLGTLKSRLHRARERLRALFPMEPSSRRQRVTG